MRSEKQQKHRFYIGMLSLSAFSKNRNGMRMDKTRERIIELCLHLFGETKAEVKRNNKSVDKLMQIFEQIKKQDGYAEAVYTDLLNYDDDRVRFEAAVCCLKLKKRVREAEAVLKCISRQNANPLISFSAETVLNKWKEDGQL